jgi:hypothetical protein
MSQLEGYSAGSASIQSFSNVTTIGVYTFSSPLSGTLVSVGDQDIYVVDAVVDSGDLFYI